MERYWMAKKALLNIPVIEGALPPDTFTQVVLYADAQRALDAEREKVKALEEQLRLANCDQANTEADLNDVTAQLATLQAQLRQVEGANTKLRDALKTIEAIICDKKLCGHFLAEEIREQTQQALADTAGKENT